MIKLLKNWTFCPKLMPTLPHFWGSLYQNMSNVDMFWCNMDSFQVCTYVKSLHCWWGGFLVKIMSNRNPSYSGLLKGWVLTTRLTLSQLHQKYVNLWSWNLHMISQNQNWPFSPAFRRFLSPGWMELFLAFCIFPAILRHKFRVPTRVLWKTFIFELLRDPGHFDGPWAMVVGHLEKMLKSKGLRCGI